ncbi:MAG: hypothetical protein Phyf2KO_06650 [Phycisphaerales bacterium]
MLARSVRYVLPLVALSASAQDIDPRGVFFHDFNSTSFVGKEWIHIWDAPGDRRFQFSDIQGVAPFTGTITTDGTTTWDTGLSGTGSFTDQDNASFDLVFSGINFESRIRRVPGTTPDFITRIDSAVSGSQSREGQWLVTIEDYDPITGAPIGTRSELFDLSVNDEFLTLTDESGDHMTGVFETEDSAGFRVVTNTQNPTFRSYEGTSTSLGLNVFADFRFTDEDAFEATFLYQTRNTAGLQTQTMERMTAVRVPAPAGGFVLLGTVVGVTRRRR